MPAIQVAALHAYWQYEQVRDDFFKWTSLPFYQGYKGMDESLAGVQSRAKTSMLLKLFTMLIPAVRSSGLALALSERRLDAIQCIEAIRLHAALSGKLPSSLEEITEAPVPKTARRASHLRIAWKATWPRSARPIRPAGSIFPSTGLTTS